MTAPHAIEIRDLAKRYGRTVALDNISIDVRQRELFALLGPNGAGKGWDKYPMATDEAALRAVLDGTTGAALVWGPALWALRNTDSSFALLHEIAPSPLPRSTADVGAILLRNQSFLRASVDHAIAALTDDGTISGILADEKFPATPVP